MIKGIIFAIIVSGWAPEGIRVESFDTMAECEAYYRGLSGFEFIEYRRNFYKSWERLMYFRTPFGSAFVLCAE